jgi:hypothetical protein
MSYKFNLCCFQSLCSHFHLLNSKYSPQETVLREIHSYIRMTEEFSSIISICCCCSHFVFILHCYRNYSSSAYCFAELVWPGRKTCLISPLPSSRPPSLSMSVTVVFQTLALQVCYAAYVGISLLTFRDNISVPPSRVKQVKVFGLCRHRCGNQKSRRVSYLLNGGRIYRVIQEERSIF